MKTANMKTAKIVAQIFDALVARKQTLLDTDQVVSTEFKMLLSNTNPEGNDYRAFLDAVDKTKKIFDFSMLLQVAHKAKPAQGNDAQYIQCKTFEKVIKFVKAFGNNDFSQLDNHTKIILFNTMYNNGVLQSKTAFVALTGAMFDELDAQSEIIKMRSKYSPGTGSTQLSSTKELFRILGATDGVKGKKDAPIQFTDEAKVAFTQHFENIAQATGADKQDDAEQDIDVEDLVDAE